MLWSLDCIYTAMIFCAAFLATVNASAFRVSSISRLAWVPHGHDPPPEDFFSGLLKIGNCFSMKKPSSGAAGNMVVMGADTRKIVLTWFRLPKMHTFSNGLGMWSLWKDCTKPGLGKIGAKQEKLWKWIIRGQKVWKSPKTELQFWSKSRTVGPRSSLGVMGLDLKLASYQLKGKVFVHLPFWLPGPHFYPMVFLRVPCPLQAAFWGTQWRRREVRRFFFTSKSASMGTKSPLGPNHDLDLK